MEVRFDLLFRPFPFGRLDGCCAASPTHGLTIRSEFHVQPRRVEKFFGEGPGGNAGVLRGVVVGVVLGVVGDCEGKFNEWCVSFCQC